MSQGGHVVFQTVGLVAHVDRKKKGLTVFLEPVSAESECDSSFLRFREDFYRRLKDSCFFLEERGYEV